MPAATGEADRRTRRRRALCVLVLLAGSLVLNLIPFWWGAAPRDTWAFDEIEPGQVLGSHLWPPKYPPLYRTMSRALLLPLERLELGPRLGWSRETTLRAYLLIMRLLNVAFATVTVWLVYRVGRRVGGWRTGWLGAAALALSAPFTYYAKMANLDSPQLFFFAASVLAALRWLDARTFGAATAMTVFAAAAIVTKTSAWSLYPLWSIAFLLAPRWSAWRLGDARRWSPIRDWRPWAALLVGIVALGVFFHLPRVMTLQQHKEGIARAVRSTPPEWTNTLGGHIGLFVDGLARWAYVLGLPLSLAAVIGLLLLFRRRERRAVALLVTLSAVSSYGLGIALLRFQADRYYLPVALLAAVTAGYALDRLLSSRRRGVVVAGVLVACFAWAGTRAVAVSRVMLTDTRLEVERWLSTRSPTAFVLGLGRPQYLPRGTAIWPLQRVQRDRCDRLAAAAPDVVLISRGDFRSEQGRDTLRLLLDGHSGLMRVRTFPRPEWSDWFIPRPKVTNLDKISPTVVALAPGKEPCHDRQWAAEEAARLLEDPQPARMELLTSFLLDHWVPGHRALLGARAVATGVDPNGWSYGKSAVALALANPSSSVWAPRIELLGYVASAETPQPVRLVVDGESRSLVLDERAWRRLRVPRLAPGERRLVLMQTERYGVPSPGSKKRRGLRVRVLR